MQGVISPAVIAHHVVEVKTDPSRRLDPANGVGMCMACHNQLHRISREVERFAQAWAARGRNNPSTNEKP